MDEELLLELLDEELLVMLLTVMQMAGAAGAATLDYYLLVYYVNHGDIGQGAVWKGVLSSAYALVSILCIPLVTRFSFRRGKLAALQWIYIYQNQDQDPEARVRGMSSRTHLFMPTLVERKSVADKR